MSNFEHWIKKDSTEFEKAFLKIYDGNLWDALEKMKDWQPPKPLVVVPQLVADFIEERKESLKLYGAFHEIDESYGTGTELYDWLFASVDSQELFARAWLDGYTVEKEKTYYLKNKITNQYINMNPYNGHCHESMTFGNCYKCVFTQSEIDDMETGSYEKIEVEP